MPVNINQTTVKADEVYEGGTSLTNKYLTHAGNTANNTVTYTSGDSVTATSWTNVATLTSGEKHSSILNKISIMFNNIRYLYKMFGTTDISGVGGTLTGAVSALNGTLDRVPNFNWQTRTLYVTNGQTSNAWVPLGTTLAVDKYTVLAIPITAYPQFFTLSVEKSTDGFYIHVYTTYTCRLTVEFAIMSAK